MKLRKKDDPVLNIHQISVRDLPGNRIQRKARGGRAVVVATMNVTTKRRQVTLSNTLVTEDGTKPRLETNELIYAFPAARPEDLSRSPTLGPVVLVWGQDRFSTQSLPAQPTSER